MAMVAWPLVDAEHPVHAAGRAADYTANWARGSIAFRRAVLHSSENALGLGRKRRGEQSRDHGYSEFLGKEPRRGSDHRDAPPERASDCRGCDDRDRTHRRRTRKEEPDFDTAGAPPLAHRDDLTGELDVVGRRLRIAGWMIVDQSTTPRVSIDSPMHV
jgi:hypothetical protein